MAAPPSKEPESLRVAQGRPPGWERVLSPLLCLVPGRSKVLWLHSCFSFLYFLLNLVFMAHHCLGFVPKRSYKVSKRKELQTCSLPARALACWTIPLPTFRGIPQFHIVCTGGQRWGASLPCRASLLPLALEIVTWPLAQLSWLVNPRKASKPVSIPPLPGPSYPVSCCPAPL